MISPMHQRLSATLYEISIPLWVHGDERPRKALLRQSFFAPLQIHFEAVTRSDVIWLVLVTGKRWHSDRQYRA